MYIHERNNWTDFRWDNGKILTVLASVRHLQGKLLGQMESLGFDLTEKATLESLILDVVDTSKIEGEFLNPELWVEKKYILKRLILKEFRMK